MYTLRDDLFIIGAFHTLIGYSPSNPDAFDSGMQLVRHYKLPNFILYTSIFSTKLWNFHFIYNFDEGMALLSLFELSSLVLWRNEVEMMMTILGCYKWIISSLRCLTHKCFISNINLLYFDWSWSFWFRNAPFLSYSILIFFYIAPSFNKIMKFHILR